MDQCRLFTRWNTWGLLFTVFSPHPSLPGAQTSTVASRSWRQQHLHSYHRQKAAQRTHRLRLLYQGEAEMSEERWGLATNLISGLLLSIAMECLALSRLYCAIFPFLWCDDERLRFWLWRMFIGSPIKVEGRWRSWGCCALRMNRAGPAGWQRSDSLR